MPGEASVPHAKLARLVKLAYHRADREALRELAVLYNQHREELTRYARRDAYLRCLLTDLDCGVKV